MTWPNVPTIISPQPPHGSNLRGGIDPPRYFASAYYQTDVGYLFGNLATTTLGGIFFEPFYVWRPQAFRGLSVLNTSTSENGKVAMLGLYNDDSNNGGPGALKHTFGQITFSTISAITTALNTVNLDRGRYWGAAWFASQCGMYRLDVSPGPNYTFLYTSPDMGMLAPGVDMNTQGWYATTTYSTTFPATAVTATASLNCRASGAGAVSAIAMFLYV